MLQCVVFVVWFYVYVEEVNKPISCTLIVEMHTLMLIYVLWEANLFGPYTQAHYVTQHLTYMPLEKHNPCLVSAHLMHTFLVTMIHLCRYWSEYIEVLNIYADMTIWLWFVSYLISGCLFKLKSSDQLNHMLSRLILYWITHNLSSLVTFSQLYSIVLQ